MKEYSTAGSIQQVARTQEQVFRRYSGGVQEVLGRYSGGVQEVLRRYSGGTRHAISRHPRGAHQARGRRSACNHTPMQSHLQSQLQSYAITCDHLAHAPADAHAPRLVRMHDRLLPVPPAGQTPSEACRVDAIRSMAMRALVAGLAAMRLAARNERLSLMNDDSDQSKVISHHSSVIIHFLTDG